MEMNINDLENLEVSEFDYLAEIDMRLYECQTDGDLSRLFQEHISLFTSDENAMQLFKQRQDELRVDFREMVRRGETLKMGQINKAVMIAANRND